MQQPTSTITDLSNIQRSIFNAESKTTLFAHLREALKQNPKLRPQSAKLPWRAIVDALNLKHGTHFTTEQTRNRVYNSYSQWRNARSSGKTRAGLDWQLLDEIFGGGDDVGGADGLHAEDAIYKEQGKNDGVAGSEVQMRESTDQQVPPATLSQIVVVPSNTDDAPTLSTTSTTLARTESAPSDSTTSAPVLTADFAGINRSLQSHPFEPETRKRSRTLSVDVEGSFVGQPDGGCSAPAVWALAKRQRRLSPEVEPHDQDMTHNDDDGDQNQSFNDLVSHDQ
ncbi:hypothetical protein HDU96_005963 [Phlyctochytrium bullatum]|nr:hypothetical protein HDU96_005963 [Phlyctochytrium bullatum]